MKVIGIIIGTAALNPKFMRRIKAWSGIFIVFFFAERGFQGWQRVCVDGSSAISAGGYGPSE